MDYQDERDPARRQKTGNYERCHPRRSRRNHVAIKGSNARWQGTTGCKRNQEEARALNHACSQPINSINYVAQNTRCHCCRLRGPAPHVHQCASLGLRWVESLWIGLFHWPLRQYVFRKLFSRRQFRRWWLESLRLWLRNRTLRKYVLPKLLRLGLLWRGISWRVCLWSVWLGLRWRRLPPPVLVNLRRA